MVLLPSDYKKRKRMVKEWGRAKTGQVAKQGTVEAWEHWDGSRDAVVKPQSMGIKMRPMTGVDLSREIAELEAAIRENEFALKSGDAGWHRRTVRRVETAKRRLAEKAG